MSEARDDAARVPSLEIVGLCKHFDHGSVRALDGVDLVVERGEFVAITGSSGCGKSTLLHLVAALDAPTSGTIRVDGRDLAERRDLDRYRRLEIGLVFQLHHLLAQLSARENVELAMYGTDAPRARRLERAEALLEELQLAHAARRPPSRLSGGERQRVAIARALANEPRVILADEPTGSLDPTAAAQVTATFQQLRRERDVTIVMVSHDPVVAGTADRVVRLVDGRVAAE